MTLAGVTVAASDLLPVLLPAAVVGVISPTGNDAGRSSPWSRHPLTETIPARERTRVLAWWNLVASLSTAEPDPGNWHKPTTARTSTATPCPR